MSENNVELTLQNTAGAEVGKLAVDLGRFDACRRKRLLKDVVVMYHAKRRRGTHDTKTRGQVKGSNRKPWRQKGTGRARAGTRKSPLWRGGGVIFGPHPRNYAYRVNKKQRKVALRSALFGKLSDGEVRVIDRLAVDSPKTKIVAAALASLEVATPCLVGILDHDPNLALSFRNLPGVRLMPVGDFNADEVLRARTVVLTKEALDWLVAAGEQNGEDGEQEGGEPDQDVAPEREAETSREAE
jgi:large subunit ribosomal protein L4